MKLSKITPYLLIGALSVLCAEVFAGSSQAWYIDAWGLIMVFPLNLSHILFFLNIALRTKRTSLFQLYFFGVIFSLYESWVTKVVWHGYPNIAEPSPLFLGIAYSEFSTISLFWHPVMSFLLPILIYETITRKFLKTHLVNKTRNKTILLAVLAVVVAAFNTTNSQHNIILSNLAIIGTIIIIILLTKILPKDSNLYSLKLGNKSLALLTLYILLLYSVTFFFLLPERIPKELLPIILVLLMYAALILIIKKSKPVKEELVNNSNSYTRKDLLKLAAALIISANIFCIIPALSQTIMITAYLIMTLGAPILFIRNVIRVIR